MEGCGGLPEYPKVSGKGQGLKEVTYAAVLSCPVHHCLVVCRVSLEHKRRADERDLRAGSRTGHRRRPRPAPLARSWGAICAWTRSKTRTMTRGAGLGSWCLQILAIAGLCASRVQQPGDLHAGTQAPGLGGAPRRPAGIHQHQHHQHQRPQARPAWRRRSMGSRDRHGEVRTLWGARGSLVNHGRR